MNTAVYVDVLLVINYVVNLLLILCTAKITGITPKRRRIVAAALFGSICSLTIFLPFLGFFMETTTKLLMAAVIVLLGLPWHGVVQFLWRWFVFFAVSFFFAGVMLGLWMLLSPQWMLYYNGIVYFNVSSLTLLVSTVLAYLLLTLAGKAARGGRLQGNLCKIQIYLGGHMCGMTGLVDTGNGLFEPFSGAPVVVCQLRDIAPLLPHELAEAIDSGKMIQESADLLRMSIRLVPYRVMGADGVLPAFRPDRLVIRDDRGSIQVEQVYIAVSNSEIGDSRYSAILNPELLGVGRVRA